VGRFCDHEPMGIIFRDIIARNLDYLNWFDSMLLSHIITSTRSPLHNHNFNLRFGLMFMFVQNMMYKVVTIIVTHGLFNWVQFF